MWLSMKIRKILLVCEIVLAFCGTAVAGTLYWAHRAGVDLPCSSGDGCDLVNASHWSHIGSIPVSLIGLAGYIFLLFVSVVKATADDQRLKFILLLLMLVVTFTGTCYSWYLQYVADVFIGAFCIYCRSSAIIMTLLFLCTAADQILQLRYSRSPS